MNCNKCGAEVHEDENFCRKCGNPLNHNYNTNTQQNQQTPNQDKNSFDKAVDFVSSTTDHTSEFDPNDIESSKAISILSYFGILFFIPLIAKPESKFARFHVNQGLVFLISSIVIQIFGSIIRAIIKTIFTISDYGYIHVSIIGSTITSILALAFNIIILIWFVLGIVNALSGKAKELPIIGKVKIIK